MPALGESWAHVAAHRLQLFWAPAQPQPGGGGGGGGVEVADRCVYTRAKLSFSFSSIFLMDAQLLLNLAARVPVAVGSCPAL